MLLNIIEYEAKEELIRLGLNPEFETSIDIPESTLYKFIKPIRSIFSNYPRLRSITLGYINSEKDPLNIFINKKNTIYIKLILSEDRQKIDIRYFNHLSHNYPIYEIKSVLLNMKKYVVTIEETLIKDVTVYSNNSDDALEWVKEKYKNEQIVLEVDDHDITDFKILESEC